MSCKASLGIEERGQKNQRVNRSQDDLSQEMMKLRNIKYELFFKDFQQRSEDNGESSKETKEELLGWFCVISVFK